MGLFALLFAGSLFYAYFFYKQVKRPDTDIYAAIPTQSALIVEVKNPIDNYRSISSNNIIWQEFVSDSIIGSVKHDFEVLDSLSRNDIDIRQFLSENTLLSCVMREGASDVSWLHAIKIPKTFTMEDVQEKINILHRDSVSWPEKTYNEVSIVNIHGAGAYYALYNDFFLYSRSEYMIERGIAQLQADYTLKDNPSFEKVYRTAGLNKTANVYVQLDKFVDLLSIQLEGQNKEAFKKLKKAGNWSELDALIRPNSLLLNGFTHSYDSLPNYLNLFNDQKPQPFEMAEILPSNVGYVEHYGLSSFESFYKNYSTKYLENSEQLKRRSKYFSQLNEKYAFNIEGLFTKWIENEWGMAIKETPKNTNDEIIADNAILILKAKDVDLALQNLATIRKRMSADIEPNTKPDEYREYEIYKLDSLAPLFGHLFGQPYQIFRNNYYTSINSFIVFANTKTIIRDIINSQLTGKTLDNDLYFNDFSDHTSSESNYMVYCNVARTPYLLKNLVKSEMSNSIEKHLSLFRKFQAASIQISRESNDMYYNNIYVQYNPVYKKETSSLWESILDTSIAMQPQQFINHYSGAQELVVQDVSNQLYLLSNSGNILWNVPLPGPILGKVHIVDRYQNEKYQMVFNTKDSLYMLDRKGRVVENYPVPIPHIASAPVSVFDYDNNRSYRMLAPQQDGSILCFDIDGKPVEGWAYESSGEVIQRALQHIMVSGRDYIISITDSGSVVALSRRGNERLHLTEKLFLGSHSPIIVKPGSNLSNSFIYTSDTAGNVLKLNLENTLETTIYKLFGGEHFFTCEDIDKDGALDYILADEHSIYAFDQDKVEIFTERFDGTISSAPQTFITKEKGVLISVTLEENSEVYLFDDDGTILENFPVFGSGPVQIADLNDDRVLELTVGASDRTIYTYTIR